MTSEAVSFVRCFRANPGELKSIRSAVAVHALGLGCSEQEAADVVLAIDEACQNIIRHAYCGDEGLIELCLERQATDLVVSIRDHAPESDPGCLDSKRDLSEVRPGGLGTHLMHSIMDEVRFLETPSREGNLLRMVKHLARPG